MASLMVPIEWSLNGIPQIHLQVNGVIELRPIDTATPRCLVYNMTASSRFADAQVNIPGLNFSFRWHRAVNVHRTEELSFPISPESLFALHNDINWFSMTPHGFHLFPVSVPFNRTFFCENPADALMIPVRDRSGWHPMMMNNAVIVIDSLAQDIQLPEELFEPFHAEVVESLGQVGSHFSYNNSNGEIIVHGCNVTALDSYLPEFEFALASAPAAIHAFPDSRVPHYIRLTAKDYMRTTPNGECHLGVIRRHTDDLVPAIGSALFRSHAVSFNPRSRSMIICRAAQWI